MKRLILIVACIAGLSAPSSAQAPQDPTEQLFVEKCSGCHSIGKGKLVGPDLKDADKRRTRDWLVKMITNPDSLLDSDPDAKALLAEFNGVRMTNLGVSKEEANALADLIARCSESECTLSAAPFVAVSTAQADIEQGRKLFTGETALVNGGPSCISCHSANGLDLAMSGGTFGKDLTDVFNRFGDEGLDGALKSLQFPVMKDVFQGKPLSPEEVTALRAFFRFSTMAKGHDTLPVFLVGAIGALFCLIVLNFLWSQRLRGVRQPLVQRSRGVQS